MEEDLLPHESSSGGCSVETQAAPIQETTARAGSVQRPMYVNSEGGNTRNKSSSSGAHDTGDRSERNLTETSDACSHLHSKPALAPSSSRRVGKGTVQMHAFHLLLSQSLSVSYTHKLNLLSRVHAGAYQPQLPPSPPRWTGCKHRSCLWTESGCGPRLCSVTTKAAVTQPPPMVPSSEGL